MHEAHCSMFLKTLREEEKKKIQIKDLKIFSFISFTLINTLLLVLLAFRGFFCDYFHAQALTTHCQCLQGRWPESESKLLINNMLCSQTQHTQITFLPYKAKLKGPASKRFLLQFSSELYSKYHQELDRKPLFSYFYLYVPTKIHSASSS